MGRYRKKPVVIDAIRWDGEIETINLIDSWIGDRIQVNFDRDKNGKPTCIIKTLEGNMLAGFGDMIIKGVSGECYPCKPDIFNKTYEKVED